MEQHAQESPDSALVNTMNDNESNVVAKIGGTVVVDIIGDTIAHVSGKDLYINNEKVGHFIGSYITCCGAIVLLFCMCIPSNS